MEILVLDLLFGFGVNLIQGIVVAIQIIQLIGAGWKKYAFSHHLDFGPKFKHVPSRPLKPLTLDKATFYTK